MNYPFPKGHLFPIQFFNNGIANIECTSFYVENTGVAPVEFLGRILFSGDSFTVPFTGVVYKQNEKITFRGEAGESQELYILQTVSQTCNE